MLIEITPTQFINPKHIVDAEIDNYVTKTKKKVERFKITFCMTDEKTHEVLGFETEKDVLLWLNERTLRKA